MDRSFIKRYKRNIRFFKKYYPDIYFLIKNQSTENIEILNTKNGINLKIDGNLFYPDDYLDSLDSKIDNFLNSPIESFNLIPDKPPKYYKKPLQEKYLKKIVENFMDIKDKNEEVLIKDKKSLFFLIVYGIGLGFHIEKLLENKKIEILILVEEKIEVFIASLYTVEWEKLFEKTSISIVLGTDPDKLAYATVNKLHRINETFTYRVFLYIHYNTNILEKFKIELKNLILEENSKWGFFDDELISIKNTLINIKNKIPIYTGKNKLNDELPLFIVASGPSLEDAIKTIKKYKNSAVIFSCGTALRPLLKNGVKPDYEIVIERMKHTYDALLDNASLEELKEVNIIGVNPMYPDVFKLGSKNYMMPRFPDSGANLFFNFYNFPKIEFMTPTVTNMALALGLHLGFKTIYLFGTDLGFKDRSKHHAKDSVYYKKESQFKTETMDSYKEVDGNFVGRVFTTRIFEMARKNIEKLLRLYPDITVYNTADGAKIEGTTPLEAEEIFIEKISNKKEEILENFESNFANNLYKKEFKHFIENKIDELFFLFDEIRKFVDENLIIKAKKFNESDYYNILFKIYQKIENDLRKTNEMFYILVRGTIYHMISFHYLYIMNLKDSYMQAKLAEMFKKNILRFLDEAKKRLKDELNC
ncbi:motility associated factor glycosyltransferase family protein [Nitrosophilus labii]|uniref:motility associated factor glycosyltransferase family protein n=1 Tax=Nitrosophilus labii TaxID=2706014 RepID=UPI001657103C|nr:6-hydroxymethylpterin diphosphokinase MptE-like protein [Nitrosophilus labii]